MSQNKKMMTTIRWVENGHDHEHLLPNSGAITLGRLDCDVTFADRTISRKHAEIRIATDGPRVRNLSRVNAVIVNKDMRLAEGDDAPLKPGDTFRLGPVTIRVDTAEVKTGSLAMRCRNCGNVNEYQPSGQCRFCGRNLSSAETIRLDKES